MGIGRKRPRKRGSGRASPLLEPVEPDGFFRRIDLARRYRVSLVTLWSWRKRVDHPLPPPLKLGPNTLGWAVSTIQAWERSLPQPAAH